MSISPCPVPSMDSSHGLAADAALAMLPDVNKEFSVAPCFSTLLAGWSWWPSTGSGLALPAVPALCSAMFNWLSVLFNVQQMFKWSSALLKCRLFNFQQYWHSSGCRVRSVHCHVHCAQLLHYFVMRCHMLLHYCVVRCHVHCALLCCALAALPSPAVCARATTRSQSWLSIIIIIVIIAIFIISNGT